MRHALAYSRNRFPKRRRSNSGLREAAARKIVPVISGIIAIKADASALKRAPQQQTGPKSGFSFRSSETNFNYLIRRMNSYIAARQIWLSRPVKFANVPPDTHGCSHKWPCRAWARNIYPHPRPPDWSNDLHRSVQRNARANVRECFANRVAVRDFFRQGDPDQVPVRVENASAVWPR